MVLIITATVVVTLFAAHRPFRLATRASSSSISACAIRRPKLIVIIAFFKKKVLLLWYPVRIRTHPQDAKMEPHSGTHALTQTR